MILAARPRPRWPIVDGALPAFDRVGVEAGARAVQTQPTDGELAATGVRHGAVECAPKVGVPRWLFPVPQSYDLGLDPSVRAFQTRLGRSSGQYGSTYGDIIVELGASR
jgi:hypothetical protein